MESFNAKNKIDNPTKKLNGNTENIFQTNVRVLICDNELLAIIHINF